MVSLLRFNRRSSLWQLMAILCAAAFLVAAAGGEASEPAPTASLSRPSPDGRPVGDAGAQSHDSGTLLSAGVASQRAGDHAAAERSFREGLALAPDDPALRAALGWTLFQTGRPAEAVTEYRRALEASPDDARLHYHLALALRATGDAAGAGAHFTRSLAIEPRCEVYADYGLVQDLFGREDLARESYEKGIALDGVCAPARMNLASMLIEDGEYEEAALHYRKVVEAQPSAAAHSGLGFALNQLGRLEEAEAQHDAAVALDASLAEVHRNRALTKARLKKYDEAIASYGRALEIEPRVSTYYSLAGVLRAAGRGEEAQEEYRRGQELSRRQQEQATSQASVPAAGSAPDASTAPIPAGSAPGASPPAARGAEPAPTPDRASPRN